MAFNHFDDGSASVPKDETALSPRSQLVSDFFDHMNAQDLAWVVMNNYNGLPEIIPSDIDFSIPPSLFTALMHSSMTSPFRSARVLYKSCGTAT